MNIKRSLESRIRGWFPQEPACTDTFPVQEKQPPSARRYTAYLTIFVGVFTIVFLLMSVTYGLGLGSYATVAAATAGVMAIIVIGILLRKPSQNKPLTEEGRRAAKIIGAANIVMVGVFLVTYFLVNPIIKSAGLTLGLWIVLLLLVFLVNNVLYRNFKKQTCLEVV